MGTAAGLENEFGQVLFFQNRLQALADIRSINDYALVLHVGRFKANILDDSFQNSVQTAGSYILSRPVDFEGDVRKGLYPVRAELQAHLLGGEQLGVLF